MVLERVARDAAENIDQTVVADFRKQSLFVIECVFGNDSWCGIGHFGHGHVLVGENWRVLDQRKTIPAALGWADDPNFLLTSRRGEGCWQQRPIPEAVNYLGFATGGNKHHQDSVG